MKISAVSTVALALALGAYAQDISSLPVCAQTPILTGFTGSGCGLTDIACVCKNADFINGLVESIPSLCTADEVAVTIEFAKSLCATYGVTLNVPEIAGGATSTSVAATSAPASTSAPAATSTPAPTSTVTPTSSEAVVASSTSSDTPATYTGAGNRVDSAALSTLMGVVALGVVAVL